MPKPRASRRTVPHKTNGAPRKDARIVVLGELLEFLEGGKRIGGVDVRKADQKMPGISRLIQICDGQFNGTGLTAENVRKLRADLCNRQRISLDSANDLSLHEIADLLQGVQRVPIEFWTPERQHISATAPFTTLDKIMDLNLPIHPGDCRIVEGENPTVCPMSDPPLPGEYLPCVVEIFKRLGLLPSGRTIHWVGINAWRGNLCKCFAEGVNRSGSSGPANESSQKSRPRGRPRDTDLEGDKRIYDSWKSRRYIKHEDLARELCKPKREVSLALDRHRKRLERRSK
jgi:hypothetical protein